MKRCSLLYLIGSILFISCEKEFKIEDFDNSSELLVANAIAYSDSLFSVSISNSFGTDGSPVKIQRAFMYNINLSAKRDVKVMTYHFDVVKFNFDTLGYASEKYKLYTNSNANVLLSVNGKDEYTFNYNKEKCIYESSYRPKDGDKLSLYVEGYADSSQSKLHHITSEVTIPKKPKIEILDIKYEYENPPGEWNGSDWIEIIGIDTVARITLKLHDIPNEKNYYKLKVRSYSKYYISGGYIWDWYPPDREESPDFADKDGWILMDGIYVPPQGPIVTQINDSYRSDDVLFRDDRLTRGYAGWKERFSNVFDDKLFKDGEYIVEVKTHVLHGTDRKLRIELQSLSEDYYQFWRSWMVYRITTDDDFAESIYIPSNVKNGYGIIGAVNSDVHMMDIKIPQQ